MFGAYRREKVLEVSKSGGIEWARHFEFCLDISRALHPERIIPQGLATFIQLHHRLIVSDLEQFVSLARRRELRTELSTSTLQIHSDTQLQTPFFTSKSPARHDRRSDNRELLNESQT
jgi:hypothetical protein